MFDHVETRDGDIPARRPYETDRRSGGRRRQSPGFHQPRERRRRSERRLDEDWRFAVIRAWMKRLVFSLAG